MTCGSGRSSVDDSPLIIAFLPPRGCLLTSFAHGESQWHCVCVAARGGVLSRRPVVTSVQPCPRSSDGLDATVSFHNSGPFHTIPFEFNRVLMLKGDPTAAAQQHKGVAWEGPTWTTLILHTHSGCPHTTSALACGHSIRTDSNEKKVSKIS